METTFKVILLIIMVLSFIGALGEPQKDKSIRFASICIASIFGMVAAMVWL